MYTAILFLFAIGAVMAHEVPAEMRKQMNDNFDRLDRLTTRIQNLKGIVEKRLSVRKDAERKSNNLILRLDRLNREDDDTFKCRTSADGRQINFKCRTGQQCIGNILVCDNVKDCYDGSDEDPDFCSLDIGADKWYSIIVTEFSCTQEESTDKDIRGTAKFFQIRQNKILPSFVQVEHAAYWTFKEEEIKSVIITTRYSPATRKFTIPPWDFNGALVKTEFYFPAGEDYFIATHVLYNSNIRCAKWVGNTIDAAFSIENFLN